jgi:hypothetical protein
MGDARWRAAPGSSRVGSELLVRRAVGAWGGDELVAGARYRLWLQRDGASYVLVRARAL